MDDIQLLFFGSGFFYIGTISSCCFTFCFSCSRLRLRTVCAAVSVVSFNSFRLIAVSIASSTETRPSETCGSASGMTLRVQYRMRFSSANSALTSSSLGRKASRSASSYIRSVFSAARCSLSRGDASLSDFTSFSRSQIAFCRRFNSSPCSALNFSRLPFQ